MFCFVMSSYFFQLHKSIKRILFATICLFYIGDQLVGQNGQLFTIETCEELFLKNNTLLLAGQFDINAKQALIIQSKLYPNPVINADINLYDPQNKKMFHIDSSGQKAFEVEQLILLGGKRRTEIDIAKTNKVLAEAEFSDLLRNLRLELHRYFYSINSQRIVIENYNRQLTILDTIIASYKRQTEKGNLPLKDLIRLKSVYIKINSNKTELSAELTKAQKQLKLLLHMREEVIPLVPEEYLKKYLSPKPIAELQDLALQNRPDIKIAEGNSALMALVLQREKKQRIPDIALNGSYDQRGGAFRNQVNMGLTMPIPLLNTNKGNIRAAEFDKRAMELYASEKRLEVELDVQQAWLDMERSIAEYTKVRDLYNEEFINVNNGINNNFHLRNISILEFVDFVESYNESLSDFEKIKKKLAETAAMINYVTASNVY